jgi:NarL family two-component system sensor histidine kinase LiaS
MRYQEEMQVKLEQLADWPRRLNRQFPVFLEDVLRRANRLMRVEKTVIVWEDGAEPWLYAASLGREGFSLVEQPPDTYLRLVEDWVQHDTFSTEDCTAVGDVVVFGEHADRIQSGCPVAPRLVEMYDMKRVLSSPLVSDTIGGRAFFLGASQFTEDDATLAQIIAALITSGLEQHFMLQQVQRSAVTEERQHFARDLHDGIVQSLAGANLHLHILERLIEKDPGQARSTLRDIQSALTHEQRELRAYIAQLRPAPGDSDTVTSVRHGLDVLAQRVERQWGVKVSIYFDPTIELASAGMREELQRIIREAVTNAAKHAGASSIQVKVHLRGDRIEATIEDDGHGFAFFGKYDLESLQTMKRGPLTLRERVAAAGGNLVLESKPNGSRIDVSLPPSLIEAHFAQANSRR